jgi:tRNA A37 threonylcarbamoyladenosine synthetase subunit TsaC/SUA5/YrdC
VEKSLGSELDLIVDAGPTSGGPPSTIVDAVGLIRLLREGPISRQQIAAALAQSGMSLVS